MNPEILSVRRLLPVNYTGILIRSACFGFSDVGGNLWVVGTELHEAERVGGFCECVSQQVSGYCHSLRIGSFHGCF